MHIYLKYLKIMKNELRKYLYLKEIKKPILILE